MKPSANVVFCDNHLLVAEKPPGWLTQPDGTASPDLETAMKQWVKEKYAKSGEVFLHAIHRLDRPVGGLVLFARTSKALSRLNEQSRANGIRRIYEAEVEGLLKEDQGELEHWLVHGEHRAIVSSPSNSEAKLARLRYRVEKRTKTTSRISIELETGRYHQIRSQFSAIGHPIVGDGRYGAKKALDFIHLHCRELSFHHPVGKELLRFESLPVF